MPADALTGPYAQQQKMLLYVLPVVFAVGGIAFPIGVLVYWTISNLWTMCQQFYVIRNNPAPGTPAADGQGGARPAPRPRARASTPGQLEDRSGVAAEPSAERRRASAAPSSSRSSRPRHQRNKK